MGRVNVSGGYRINALIKEYEIAAGENINAGDLVRFINNKAEKSKVENIVRTGTTFSGNYINYVTATRLDSEKVLVAYRFEGYNEGAVVALLLVDGSSISIYNSIGFISGFVQEINITVLDQSRVLLVYRTLEHGEARIIYVGNNINVYPAITFANTICLDMSVTIVDINKALVVYRDNNNSNYGKVLMLTISNFDITAGSPVIFNRNISFEMNLMTLSTNKVLLTFNDNNNYGKVVQLTVENNNILVGLPVVFNNGSAKYISSSAIDSKRVLLAYVTGSKIGKATMIFIDDNVISMEAPIVFSNTFTEHVSIVGLDLKRALLVYSDSNYGKSVILDINGNIITLGDTSTIIDRPVLDIEVAKLDFNKALVVYNDSRNSNYGMANVIEINHIVEGIAVQNGVEGEIKKFYEWR